jgi:hypothetical protein
VRQNNWRQHDFICSTFPLLFMYAQAVASSQGRAGTQPKAAPMEGDGKTLSSPPQPSSAALPTPYPAA